MTIHRRELLAGGFAAALAGCSPRPTQEMPGLPPSKDYRLVYIASSALCGTGPNAIHDFEHLKQADSLTNVSLGYWKLDANTSEENLVGTPLATGREANEMLNRLNILVSSDEVYLFGPNGQPITSFKSKEKGFADQVERTILLDQAKNQSAGRGGR